MVHLSNEFSMELLLSLIEFIQFKLAIQANNVNQETTTDTGTFYLTVELAECIPKSSIVVDETQDFEQKALRLYQKYVRIGSEYEINIHSSLRKHLMDRFDEQANSNVNQAHSPVRRDSNDATDLQCVFDECCKEMIKLLGFSLTRFKAKPEYLRLQGLHE